MTSLAQLDNYQANIAQRDLRAKPRQLGRRPRAAGRRLRIEQWHRLMFARFLAENNLFIHPQLQGAVTLGDCEELAAELGEPDGGRSQHASRPRSCRALPAR